MNKIIKYCIIGVLFLAVIIGGSYLLFDFGDNTENKKPKEEVISQNEQNKMILPGYMVEKAYDLGNGNILLLQVSQSRMDPPKLQIYNLNTQKVQYELSDVEVNIRNIKLQLGGDYIAILTEKNEYKVFDYKLKLIKTMKFNNKLSDTSMDKILAVSNDLKTSVYIGDVIEKEEQLNALYIMNNDSGTSEKIKNLSTSESIFNIRNLYFTSSDDLIFFVGSKQNEDKETQVYGYLDTEGNIVEEHELSSKSTFISQQYKDKVILTASESGVAGRTKPSKEVIQIDLKNKQSNKVLLQDEYDSYQTYMSDKQTLFSCNSYQNHQRNISVDALRIRIYQKQDKFEFTGKEVGVQENYDIASFQSFIYNKKLYIFYHTQDYTKQYVIMKDWRD